LSQPAARAQVQALLARRRRATRRLRVGLFAAAMLVLTTSAWAARMAWPTSSHERPREPASRSRTARPAVEDDRQAARDAPRLASAASDAGLPADAALPYAASAPRAHAAQDWLDLANAARAQHDFARAEQLYLRTASLHPGTDDAAAATLAAAELRSQHLGDARGAVALYRALISARPKGPLAEQAHAGLARAYGALGDRRAERAAWRQLLRVYPDSWFANEARAQLQTR
jgi:tetratricopeptide (TPR) repeat protein